MYLAAGFGITLSGIVLAWLVNVLPGARLSVKDALRTPWRGDTGAVLALTAIALLFFWPVVLEGHTFPKGGGDLWGQLYPVWSFVGDQVRQGIVPLWDPLLMAGDPILSEAQYGLLNPLNWPLFVLSPPPAQLVLWRGMVSVLIAGVGMYLFLTRSPGLRLSRPAGLLGAVAYMLADPFIVHLGHPQINDAMAWLPWSLLGIAWGLQTPRLRQVAWAGIPVALMVLAGHGQMALYGLITAALYGLWQSLALPAVEGGGDIRINLILARLGRLTLVAFVGFTLAAPMLLPAIERMPWTNRSLVPDDERRGYEFSPTLLADTLAPHIHGRGSDGWWSTMDRVETSYVGAITLFLAVLGLVTRPRQAAFWLGVGVLAFVFALGYQAPLFPAVAKWPFFDALWKTARAIFLTAFALVVLGALGLQTLLDHQHRRWARVWSWLLVIGGIALAVAAPRLLSGVPAGLPYQRAMENLWLVAGLTLGVAALAWFWQSRRQSWALAGIILLLVAEMTALGALAETDPSPTLAASVSTPEHAAALAFLRSDTGWFRVDSQGRARHLWSPETLQVQGFEVLQGSGNPLSLWPFEQFYWTQPTKAAPGYRLLGAKYILVPKGDPPPGEEIWPVFTDDPLIDVHLNTRALPRAWLVYQTESVADYGAAWQRIQNPDFDPAQIAIIENGPRLDGQGSGQIEVVHYSPNQISLIVRTDASALLVLSDVFYPGWQGYIDGAKMPIYRTDATFRGMIVPAGSHTVEMRFFPRSLSMGSGLALVGLFLLGLGVVPDSTVNWLCRKLPKIRR